MQESVKFQKLNFPDPHNYGDIYKPIFPPYHKAVKVIMDNIPDSVEKIYVFGSQIRWDCATNTDLDVFIVGSVNDCEYKQIYNKLAEINIPVDILIETYDKFMSLLDSDFTSIYRKVYEGGYKIYDREEKR